MSLLTIGAVGVYRWPNHSWQRLATRNVGDRIRHYRGLSCSRRRFHDVTFCAVPCKWERSECEAAYRQRTGETDPRLAIARKSVLPAGQRLPFPRSAAMAHLLVWHEWVRAQLRLRA
jgi:hypothetical protein